MKKIMRRTLLVLLVIVLVAVAIIFANPLRRSEEHIRNNILELTPIGMDMDEVIKIIESKENWETRYISHTHGYRNPGKPDPVDAAWGRGTIVGDKSIRVLIGEYNNIFVTSVTVFWGFDENSKLIDVYVWKTTDAP